MQNEQRDDRRSYLIEAVQTKLGFFVLVVLVLEAMVGAVIWGSPGVNVTVAVVGMLAVIILLIGVVTFCAIKRPYVLLYNASQGALHEFCQRVAGHWWSKPEDDSGSIGFVTLRHDQALGNLVVQGRSYDGNGRIVASWESVASCIHVAKAKVYYYWTGHHQPTDSYGGFGEISFHDSEHHVNSGDGVYSDTNLADATSTTRKSSGFRRCTDQEAEVMLERDDERRVALLREKLRMGARSPEPGCGR